MNEEWGTPISKDKIIYRRNKLVELAKVEAKPYTIWHETINENLLDINYMIYEIERLNNIINTMLDFNFFKEECPLNLEYIEKCDEEKAQDVFYEDDYCEETCNDDYKKCWLKYFERLQELKGSDK